MRQALAVGKKNRPIQLDDELNDDRVDMSVPSSDASNSSYTSAPSSGTASKRMKKGFFEFTKPKAKGPTIQASLRKTPEEVVDERHRPGFTQTTIENRMRTKEEKERVHQHIADWFYECGIPFNAANSRSFEVMIESIGQYGPGLKPPTYHELRVPLLEKAKKKTEQLKEVHKASWKEYGCTLMSDGWTDKRNRHLINFLVNSPAGTYFIGSVNASSQSQDAELLAKLLDEKIEEIGPENIIQIVTDNASNYKAASRKLMENRPTLFWTPCAAHCLDLMLEDIGKLARFKSHILKSRGITNFIYRHGKLLEAMRQRTEGKDLVRAGVTGFATTFLTLQSLWKHKDALRDLFLDDDWKSTKLSKTEAAKKVVETIFSIQFWNAVEDCIRVSQPLLVALRMVDGDERPALPEIFAAMEKAKEKIKANVDKKPTLCSDVLGIIERRWECQMEQQLYDAGLFLNADKYFKLKKEKSDMAASLRLDFNDVLSKMVPDQVLQDKISLMADAYDGERENFGRDMAVRQRELKNPIDWWTSFGGRAIDLMKFAKRILGLCCSASGCERNWSSFEFVHTKRRNRLEHKRLNDLVFVQYNRRLMTRFKKRRELGKSFDPLQLDDFDWGNEWIIDSTSREVVHHGDDLTWEHVDTAMGASVGAQGRQFPRAARGDTTTTSGSSSRASNSMQLHDSDSDGETQPILPSDDEDVDDYGEVDGTHLDDESDGGGNGDDEVMIDDYV